MLQWREETYLVTLRKRTDLVRLNGTRGHTVRVRLEDSGDVLTFRLVDSTCPF